MQFCDSLQFLNLSLVRAFSDAVSGIIFISAFRPLLNLVLSSLRLPSLLSCSWVLTVALSDFNSIISSLIFVRTNLFSDISIS